MTGGSRKAKTMKRKLSYEKHKNSPKHIHYRWVTLRVSAAGCSPARTTASRIFGNMPLSHRHLAIITFDAPGTGTVPSKGTLTYVINRPWVQLPGYYFDSKLYNSRLCARHANGTFSTFDAPGAGTGPYQWHLHLRHELCGEDHRNYVEDSSYVLHGYLRAPDGTFTMFDVPGAGTGQFQGNKTLKTSTRAA